MTQAKQQMLQQMHMGLMQHLQQGCGLVWTPDAGPHAVQQPPPPKKNMAPTIVSPMFSVITSTSPLVFISRMHTNRSRSLHVPSTTPPPVCQKNPAPTIVSFMYSLK
jgi:hypothetical protein